MGAYRSKPVTEKVSEGGEYQCGNRKIVYGTSSMQGWRMFMEDAHSVIPHFDDDSSSLFGVYDGHGGREVAVYCAMHLADIIKSTVAYRQGNLEQALKDAFMKCDRIITEEKAIKEMRKYAEDEISNEEHDIESEGELESLLEESSLPLHNLLARYNVPTDADPVEKNSSCDLQRQGISTILQLLTRNPDIEFDDSDSESVEDSDKEVENEPQSDYDISDDSSASPQKVLTSVSEPNNIESVSEVPNSTSHDQSIRTSNDMIQSSSLSSGCLISNSDPDSKKVKKLESLKRHDKNSQECPTVDILKRKSSATKFEPKSLMDLLTSKPAEKSMIGSKLLSPITSRKRPHQSDDNDDDPNCSSPRKHIPSKLDKQGYHSGTTAVVGILRENDFVVANAGDSKCVITSKGKAVDMSFDHKPTDQIELDRITNAGGHVGSDNRVNGGLNLSRAIGDHFYKKNISLSLEDQMISAMPDIKSVPVTDDNEFIVFACDGIWNSMSSQEVVDFICCQLKKKVGNEIPTQQNLSQVCEKLCDACLATGTDNDGTGCDNMTCILIFLKTL